jgi:hypothetical protein
MNHRVIRKAIGICWIILVGCFLVKAIGGNWFASNLVVPEIESNITLISIISSVTSYILFTFYYLALCGVKNFKIWVHLALIPYFFIITLLKVFVITNRFYILLDILSNFIVPALLITYVNKGFKNTKSGDYFKIIIAFCLNSGFQTISVIVRDISVNVIITGFIPQLVLTLDALIMLILYWLYSLLFKKEVKAMGLVFTLLMGKGIEELNSMLDSVNSKLEKDPTNSELLEEKSVIEKALSEK